MTEWLVSNNVGYPVMTSEGKVSSFQKRLLSRAPMRDWIPPEIEPSSNLSRVGRPESEETRDATRKADWSEVAELICCYGYK